MVALNSLQVVNNLLDRGFIGHLESSALTAQGASINVMFLMFSLAMAVATAATALVSRAFGAHKAEELRGAARQSLSLTLLLGIAMAIVGALLTPTLARVFLPASDTRAIELMTRYLLVYMAGLPAVYMVQTLAGSLRGIGDTKSPMVISGIQILLHIALNFVLIFPPRDFSGTIHLGPLERVFSTAGFEYSVHIPGAGLGLVGAGTALALSAWLSAIAYTLYADRTPLGSSWRLEIPQFRWARRILAIAMPAAGQAFLRVASLWAFTIVLKSVSGGSAAIAAMSVGFAIESIMFMPAFGLSAASGALVGQSLGARNPERAEKIGWLASHYGALVILLLSIPIIIFADQIAYLLVGGKADIAREAASLIRILCATEVMFGYAMILIGAIQGAGDTKTPMWITVGCLWGVRVPLAYILALPLGMGATGAWIAMSATQLMQGLVSIWAFKRGKWKHIEI